MKNKINKHLSSPRRVSSSDDGVLSFTELDIDGKRLYWLSGPSGPRGGHAHKRLRQTFIAISGRIRIKFSDGTSESLVELTSGHELFVEPGLWREIEPLSGGDILLVVASEHFDEADYIRDFDEFRNWRQNFDPLL